MSYSIPLQARDMNSAILEARNFLVKGVTAKTRMTEDQAVFLFVFKGHIVTISKLEHATGSFYMLRGHNYGLRELIKGTKPVSVDFDGLIRGL